MTTEVAVVVYDIGVEDIVEAIVGVAVDVKIGVVTVLSQLLQDNLQKILKVSFPMNDRGDVQ